MAFTWTALSLLYAHYVLFGLALLVIVYCAGYWLLSFVAGTVFAKLHLHKKITSSCLPHQSHPAVSIIKPLVGADDINLASNLETFFTLKYPCYEILFCVHEDTDPALDVVRALMLKYPHVNAGWFTAHGSEIGVNPKINNMLPAYLAAKYRLLLISDAGIRMRPDTLTDMVSYMRDDVGLVTQLPFTADRKGFAATYEKIYFGTVQARLYLCATAWGVTCVTGMSCLIRRSVIDSAGGLQAFACYLAEDFFMAEATKKCKLGITVSSQPALQNSAICNVRSMQKRLSRWTKLRIAMVPFTSLNEPFAECLLLGALASASVSFVLSWNALVFLLCHTLVWMLADYIMLNIVQGGPLSCSKFEFVVAWLFRELTALPLFLYSCIDQRIEWRRGSYRLRWGGIAERLETRKGSAPPLSIKA